MSQRNRRIQTNLRRAVFARDRGICSKCGRDCEALRKKLRDLPYPARILERKRLGIVPSRRTYWDAHHLVAVVDGGPDTLANAVTLCFRCHPRETAKLVRTLAHDRAAGRPQATALGEIFG